MENATRWSSTATPPRRPRIDLILGVALAVIISALGMLGSFGFGAAAPPRELIAPQRQIATAPDASDEAFASMDLADFDAAPFTFDVVEPAMLATVPDAPATNGGLWRFSELQDAIVVLENDAYDGDVDARMDRQRVVRLVTSAARLASDDPEYQQAIDELKITVESLVDEFHRSQPSAPIALPTPEGPEKCRSNAMRRPVRTIGL